MFSKIATMSTIGVYLVLFAISLVGGWILFSLSEAAKKIASASQGENGKKGTSKLGCLTFLFFLLAIFAFLTYSAFLRAFHVFTKEELVAIVECLPSSDRNFDFELQLTPIVNKKQQSPLNFEIKGDQWAVGGDILKWHSIANMIGLHSMYRLTRVEGRFRKAIDQKTKHPSVYPLTEEEESRFWHTLYKVGDKLPLVSSVYGNTVYTDPSFTDSFEIYVTISGFSAKRIRQDDKSLTEQIMDKFWDATLPKRQRDDVPRR
ncbi:MAG: hypothetical protein GXO75_13760 [Calditrichaeota bacterium]|nr:hypothetical protein [Calditrichota bacterium]